MKISRRGLLAGLAVLPATKPTLEAQRVERQLQQIQEQLIAQRYGLNDPANQAGIRALLSL